MATTNLAIAGSILRNFSIAFVSIVGAVFGVREIVSIAARRQMAEGERGHLGLYNARVHPEQDRLYGALFIEPDPLIHWLTF